MDTNPKLKSGKKDVYLELLEVYKDNLTVMLTALEDVISRS